MTDRLDPLFASLLSAIVHIILPIRTVLTVCRSLLELAIVHHRKANLCVFSGAFRLPKINPTPIRKSIPLS